jgi:beta-phosphoglucomutase-like phosphatase (HAD superfamily)
VALLSRAGCEEIETALDSTGPKRYFLVIVAAEDFVFGKPHPEIFIPALERLNALFEESV